MVNEADEGNQVDPSALGFRKLDEQAKMTECNLPEEDANKNASTWWNRLLVRLCTKSMYSYIWYFYHRKLVKFTGPSASGSNASTPTSSFRSAVRHAFEEKDEVEEAIQNLDAGWLMNSRSAYRIHLPIFLIIIMVIRGISVILLHLMVPNVLDYISEKHLYMFAGSPFHLLHSTTIHSEIMAITWGINTMVQYFLVVHNPETSRLFLKANFLVNLIVFYDEYELKKRDALLGSSRSRILHYQMLKDPMLQLMHTISLDGFRQRSKAFMASVYLFNFGMAGNVTFTTLMIAYYDFSDSPLECTYVLLVWTPIWTLYTYFCAIYAYYIFFYFIIFTCLFCCVMNEITANLMAKMKGATHYELRKKTFDRILNRWLVPIRGKSIGQLMHTYNQILRVLKSYSPLWSRYITIVLIIFNGLVCFNFYLYFYTHSTYYIQMVYIATSITAFNIFFCSNYFAAKIVVANGTINRPLFGLFSKKLLGRQKFTHFKLLDCVTYEKLGILYIDKTLITMMTLQSVISFLFMGFVLFINLSSAVPVDSE